MLDRNVSHLAQAQVPQIGSGGDGSKETCSRCSQAVYFAERVASMGKVIFVWELSEKLMEFLETVLQKWTLFK